MSMLYEIDAERCKGCGLCVHACPKKILAVSKKESNRKGYHVLEMTDEESCVCCAACARMCPDTVITIAK